MKYGFSLRRLAIKTLFRINAGDITIRHQYTKDRIRLHSFRHKSYWYHGKAREKKTMRIFSAMLGPGSFAVEVGGHIGYISLYMASLVGPLGKIVVFEPGPNNLPYIRKNIASHAHIILVEKAVADFVGPAQFHIESFSGQNNSLLDHYRILDSNLESAGIAKVHTSTVEVLCTTLDVFLEESNLPLPSFVKIDAEGAEFSVLGGMKRTLQKDGIALMVEVTENQEAVFRLLKEYRFATFNDSRKRIDDPRNMSGNVFCLKENDPRITAFLS